MSDNVDPTPESSSDPLERAANGSGDDANGAEAESTGFKGWGCIAGLAIMMFPLVLMGLSPAEGFGWYGVMMLPITTILGLIVGIIGLVSFSRGEPPVIPSSDLPIETAEDRAAKWSAVDYDDDGKK